MTPTEQSLRKLTRNWDTLPRAELLIRVRTLAYYGMFNDMPGDVYNQWCHMRMELARQQQEAEL